MQAMRATLTLFSAILLMSSAYAYAEADTDNLRAGDNESTVENASQATPKKTQDVLMYALSLTGTPYKYGGNTSDTGFDCSGFVRYVYGQVAGLNLPRNALSISQVGTQIAKTELKPGDLVFFNTLRRAFSHVGIYLGDNRFIHASSSTSGDVMVSDLNEKYWSKRFNGARRYALSE